VGNGIHDLIRDEIVTQGQKGNNPPLQVVLQIFDNIPQENYQNLRSSLDYLYFRELPEGYQTTKTGKVVKGDYNGQ
jgi:hypothetical protein